MSKFASSSELEIKQLLRQNEHFLSYQQVGSQQNHPPSWNAKNPDTRSQAVGISLVGREHPDTGFRRPVNVSSWPGARVPGLHPVKTSDTRLASSRKDRSWPIAAMNPPIGDASLRCHTIPVCHGVLRWLRLFRLSFCSCGSPRTKRG